VAIDGLLATEFQFGGPESAEPHASQLTGYFGYTRSTHPPGIYVDEGASNPASSSPSNEQP